MKFRFRRAKPKPHISNGILRNSFDRRTVVLGSVQGGVACLLAARLGYLAVFENEKYQLEAESNRAVAQHQLNQNSSRSHVLYMIRVDRRSKVADGAVISCRLTLVDLAGSERLKKSANSDAGFAPTDAHSAKQLAKEAMSINKSLTFLEQVVVALAQRKSQ